MLALWLAAAAPAFAQSLTVTLNVSANPNPYVSEWSSRRETAMLTVTNPGASSVDAKIAVRILIGTQLQAETKFNELPTITIPARSTQTYFGEDIVPFGAMKFFGGVESKTLRTGQLPAGNYTFCLRVLDAATAQPLSQEICKPFRITSYQGPRLLLPANMSTMRPEERPTFRWTQVTPNHPMPVTYRFLLFEVLQGQTPMQAFRGNQPIIERRVTGLTQLLWLPELPTPEPAMTYIWTVQALDANDNPIGDRDGYADPFVLKVGNATGARKSDGVADVGEGGGARGRSGGEGTGEAGDRRSGADPGVRMPEGGQGGGNERSVGEGAKSGAGGIGLTPVDIGGNAKKSGIGEENTQVIIPITNPQPPPSTCGNPSYACPPPSCTSLATGTFADGDSVTICNFTMKFDGAPTGTSAALNGNGKIWVPWMRTNIAVKFTNIKINTSNEVCTGTVYAQVDTNPPTYPQQWAINMVGSFNWTKKQVKDLNTWLHQQGGTRVKKLTDSLDMNQLLAEQTAAPVKVPLGFNNVEGVTIAISEIKFEPTGAHLNCVAAFPVVFDHNDTLGFKGANFPFGPSAPHVSSGKLALLYNETFTGNINDSATYEITFKAEQGPNPGTFVSWDCKGFRELNVDMDIAFPRQWLLPIPDNGTARVKANVKTNVVAWSDWLIQATLPPCTVTGTNGLALEVQGMVYDHSDVRNATGMVFPANYTGDQSVAFNGFYLKLGKVVLPDKLRTFANPAQPVKILVTDMIINKLGITGQVLAQNVVNFPDGNISGLGASIDTIKVVLKNSSLESAYMRGAVVIPVSEVTAPNAISYKALFNTNNGFQFTMQPVNPIDAKLFAGAKLTIAATSNMTMTISGGQTSFDLSLNGKFDWNDIKIGNKVKVKMVDMTFQNMKMSYRENTGMSYSPGVWTFASPPKWIANFPVSIDSIKYVSKTKGSGEVLRGGLGFDVVLNLSENTISGRTSLECLGAIEKPPGGKFTPKFVGVDIKDIEVHASLAAVKIDGKAIFYNDDPTYGDGFQGTLKAVFNSLQMQIDASARFGATEYQSPGDRYRYWGVEAKAILPKPGIVFLPGVAFYGFGAGAWRRMNVNTMPKPDLNAIAGAATSSTQTSSGATFTPNKNNGFGFKVQTVLGTAPDPKTFNADAGLLGEFSMAGGLTKIAFNLDAWGAAGLLERNKAPIYGSALVQYVPPTKEFDLNALVHFKYPQNDGSVVKTTGSGISLKMNINGSTGLWYFKLGEPSSPNSVTVLNAFNVQEYLMFGNNIQAQTGFLPSTVAGLNQAGVSVGFQNQGISSQASLGQGFAAGVTVFGNTGDKFVDLAYRTKLKFGAGGGFEINMSLLRYPPTVMCEGTPLGMNGWYAQGGLAAWFYGYAGIQITNSPKPDCDCCPKVWKDCCNPFKCCAVWCGSYYYNVLDIRFGARLNGGFARPTWVNGQAGGSYSVCGGLFSGSFTANLEIGKPCSIGQPEQTATFVAEDAAATIEQQSTLLLVINPANNASGFPPDRGIGVVFGFKPNDAFDVFERQADGSVKKRTFQARYTAKLDSLGQVAVSNGPVPTPLNPNAINKNDGGPPAGPVQVQVGAAKGGGGPQLNAGPPAGPIAMQHIPSVIVLKMSAGPNALGEYEYRIDRGAPKIGVWMKNLDDKTRYKFTITGELWEKQGANWVKATKRNGGFVTETMTTNFSTGVSPKIAPNAPTPVLAVPPSPVNNGK